MIQNFIYKAIEQLTQWIIIIINEVSIGLFHVQEHLKFAVTKLEANNNSLINNTQQIKLANSQLIQTKHDIEEIISLNNDWSQKMSQKLFHL